MAIGTVSNASPVGTLPVTLSSAFTRAQAYSIYANRYPNGESQRSLISATSRKVWDLTKTLNAADLTELRAFYEDHDGPLIPFNFHDPYEAGITGDYVVRFDGIWSQTVGLGELCGQSPIRLIELA